MKTRNQILSVFLVAAAIAIGGCASAPEDSPWIPCDGDRDMMEAVKSEFMHVWSSYRDRAWGHDEVNPVRGHFRNLFGDRLAMTMIDSLDTLLIMDEDGEFDAAVEWIAKSVDFDRDTEVDVSMTAGRILCGLLSAYEMSGEDVLLEKARDLGDRLRPAFESPTGLPYARVNLKTGAVSGSRISPADVGVLDIAFGLLSRHTDDFAYVQTSRAALLFMWNRRSSLGLMGSVIDVETAEWVNKESHVDEGLGSCYISILTAARLFDEKALVRINGHALDAVNRMLRDECGGIPWYGATHMEQGMPRRPYFGSAGAAWPGYLVRVGAAEDAAGLQGAWFEVWKRFGGEPQYYDYEKGEILNPAYVMQPGIAQSALVLWRSTGDPHYREQGKRILADLKKHCRAPYGYAALSDVATHEKDEGIIGCFPAEIFKNLYLLFAPNDEVDLDEWILGPCSHPALK